MKISFYFRLAFLFLYPQLVIAQSGNIGKWTSHLPNKTALSVAAAGDQIYAGGTQTFFTYNRNKGSIQYNSKIKNFSGSSISQVAFSKETNTIVIAYDNSMIDLVVNNKVIPVNSIFRSNLVGSKKVNHLYVNDQKAYFSTDYGLVIYNLRKQQIEEVCKTFTSVNTNTKVTSATIFNDSIFIATDKGLFAASASDDVNKLDYRNWKEIGTEALNLSDLLIYIASDGTKLYTATEARIESYQNGKFMDDPELRDAVYQPESGKLQGLKSIDGQLFIMQNKSLLRHRNGSYEIISRNASPVDITVDNQNQIWVADPSEGLLRINNGNAERIITNGPYSNFAFQLYYYQGKMMILTGGYNYEFYGSLNRPFGFSILDNGIWSNYSHMLNNIPVVNDISSAKYNAFSNKLFFASYGNGVLEWNLNNQEYKTLNYLTPGVPLGTSKGVSTNRVPDIAIDSKGVTWVLNTPDPNIGNSSIFKYNQKGEWDSVVWIGQDKWGSYNYSRLSNAPYFLHKVFIDKNDNKWLASRYYSLESSSGIGLFVYNEDKSPLPRYLRYEKDRFNEICGKQVYSITQDLDGAIWIGTENGVCYFSDPEEVFLRKPVRAVTPLLGNQALLRGVRVTGIDCDGSNRKWISTAGEGLLLVSPDGSKIISSFNEDNSPLVSKFVNDVKVNKVTGEVFVATDDGVFSYAGSSIEGKEVNENVVAYPNPLKKEFSGYFTLDGLVNKAIVKITDMSGALVYESKSEGSRFTWNVRDYNGNRPKSGVYLIYSSKDDGSESLVTKIAILD